MIPNVRQLLISEPEWQVVLAAYVSEWTRLVEQLKSARKSSPAENPPADDEASERTTAVWVPRISQVDGVEPGRMAPIHGKLIAHGLLKFQLLSRTEGVVYQPAPRARQLLEELAQPAQQDEAA